MHRKYILLGLLVLAFGLLLTACAAPAECPEPTDCPEAPACPDCPDCPEPPPCPEPLVDEVPYAEMWAASGHNDFEAEAFRHWDEDDPAVVSVSCAKCHSTPGYLDFLGADGSEFGTVEADAPVDTTVECGACHNEAASAMDSVVMPSGVELTGLGDEARCMQCHQGRASKFTVDGNVEELDLEPDDVSEELGFSNIHYFAAAATKYGTLAKGGYEYDGKTYDGNFAHVESYDTCIECHDSHTLEVRGEGCVMCHEDQEYIDYRMLGSLVDYDGDGDLEEGLAHEITGLQDVLYSAIQEYAASESTPIIYDSHSYPYFFIDTDGDGAVTEGEANYGNKYAGFTPKLLQAAYNYQVSLKDPGGFAHGGKYIIQLLYDSIESLSPEMVAGLHRDDHGHFAGSEEAFRHWDEDGEVSASCAKCHTASGLPLFAHEGVNITAEISNGFQCETCHDHSAEWPERFVFESVTFPSGATVADEDATTNLCMNCHQGRSSTVSVAKATADLPDDEVAEGLRFSNVHYFAAGATRYGTEVQGGFEFEGEEYVGLFAHVPNITGCSSCHDAHALEVKYETCAACHTDVASPEDLANIRLDSVDYDGDGDAAEGIAGEIATMTDALREAVYAYSYDIAGTGIFYDSHAYPYFFTDANGNGEADEDEVNYGNRYATWTPNLLKAAYNYQYALKDPGGYAHNAKYVLQLLYDSIGAVGGDVSGMTRPEVPAE